MSVDRKEIEPQISEVGSDLATSVTRFGDFLDFGQLFKAFGRN